MALKILEKLLPIFEKKFRKLADDLKKSINNVKKIHWE